MIHTFRHSDLILTSNICQATFPEANVAMTFDVVVLGATGFTGRLACDTGLCGDGGGDYMRQYYMSDSINENSNDLEKRHFSYILHYYIAIGG